MNKNVLYSANTWHSVSKQRFYDRKWKALKNDICWCFKELRAINLIFHWLHEITNAMFTSIINTYLQFGFLSKNLFAWLKSSNRAFVYCFIYSIDISINTTIHVWDFFKTSANSSVHKTCIKAYSFRISK